MDCNQVFNRILPNQPGQPVKSGRVLKLYYKSWYFNYFLKTFYFTNLKKKVLIF
jgi:hypothetical protein